MTIRKFTLQDREILIEILLENDWQFHGIDLNRKQINRRIDTGFFTENESKTFLLYVNEQAIGFFRIFDLGKSLTDDDIPLFDIRIINDRRGKGFGKQAVKWLTDYVFSNYPNKNRIEATTRHDNIAMRKVLEQCGYLKEAHYRQSWRTKAGDKVDTVGYGILRYDWENGVVTTFNWED